MARSLAERARRPGARPTLVLGTPDREGTRMGTNLASIVTESAARDAAAPAVRLGERTLTYGELADGGGPVATLVRERGVEPGDRVGVMLPNVPEFPLAYYGILQAGAVVVPMNVLL